MLFYIMTTFSHIQRVIDLLVLGPKYANADVLKTIFANDGLFKVKEFATIFPNNADRTTTDLLANGVANVNFQLLSKKDIHCQHPQPCHSYVYLNTNFLTRYTCS